MLQAARRRAAVRRLLLPFSGPLVGGQGLAIRSVVVDCQHGYPVGGPGSGLLALSRPKELRFVITLHCLPPRLLLSTIHNTTHGFSHARWPRRQAGATWRRRQSAGE